MCAALCVHFIHRVFRKHLFYIFMDAISNIFHNLLIHAPRMLRFMALKTCKHGESRNIFVMKWNFSSNAIDRGETCFSFQHHEIEPFFHTECPMFCFLICHVHLICNLTIASIKHFQRWLEFCAKLRKIFPTKTLHLIWNYTFMKI